MEQVLTPSVKWTFIEKISFRFFFLFFVLQIFPFPLGYLLDNGFYNDAWTWPINWAGNTFFDIPEISVRPNGSGDTTWNWIQLFLITCLSFFGTAVWTAIDSKKTNYNKLNYWFSVIVRFYLGITMLSYGFAKVFFSQFGTVTSYRLYEQFGDMSPMGLLWTFMAFSKGYQFFTGLGEVVGGFLLFFRRTTLIGSLVLIGVMSNVVLLNFFYDVPVKIFSSLLLSMAFYLAAADLKRLMNLFFLNRPVPARTYPLYSQKKWFKWSRIVLKTLIIGGIGTVLILQGINSLKYQKSPQSAFYGPYQVKQFKRNQLDVPLTDTLRWERMFVDRRGATDIIAITNQYGMQQRIGFERNEKKKSIVLSEWLSNDKKHPFTYVQPDSNTLILSGKWNNDSLYLELQKMHKKFQLIHRGFHWVNEQPFNK
ncbi:DoxX family protein [Runella sp.]|uniref:DoxX family protein n=1 Tax=Runella sp. TaxID=1960881 RepID=UPI003D0CC130